MLFGIIKDHYENAISKLDFTSVMYKPESYVKTFQVIFVDSQSEKSAGVN